MAPAGTVFGGRKFRGGRDPAEEQAALQWIYAILQEPKPDLPFDELLKDGQVLCRLMRKVDPRLIRKINTSGGPIKLMENLAVFTEACRQLGVQHYDLFQSIDMWDQRDIGAVYNCLSQLGGILQTMRPDLPAYGPRIAEENTKFFSEQQTRAVSTRSTNSVNSYQNQNNGISQGSKGPSQQSGRPGNQASRR